jgi:ABC-type branched-subunit amino acid transport system ATPase component
MALMAIVGGKGTLWGPVIGAMLFHATQELFWTYLLGWQRVAMGLFLAKRFLPAGALSFGQQKLLEFAMALMNRPKMLLLDEPTTGINPTLINQLIDRLKRVNADFGITLLVIEHNLRVIMNLVQYVYCLVHGELLAEGSPDAIQTDQAVIDAYLEAR